MRVFVTGATGFIGSAVVRELIAAGHRVLGLARGDAGAAALAAAGAEAHLGELSDMACLAAGAQACDGVIHTAFMRPAAGYAAPQGTTYASSADVDRAAIEALGAALAGSGKPLVVTSGTLAVPAGRVGTEADAGDAGSVAAARVPSEVAALGLAAHGVRAAVLRLPPTVHGDGDHGFVPTLIEVARDKRVSAYVGDGRNRWPAVHRLDAAELYRLVLEQGVAGARYHAVGEEGVPVGDIAAVIGRRLAVPVVSMTAAAAVEHLGRLGGLLGIDAPASSARTQAALGWRPTRPGLIADIDREAYFPG